MKKGFVFDLDGADKIITHFTEITAKELSEL